MTEIGAGFTILAMPASSALTGIAIIKSLFIKSDSHRLPLYDNESPELIAPIELRPRCENLFESSGLRPGTPSRQWKFSGIDVDGRAHLLAFGLRLSARR